MLSGELVKDLVLVQTHPKEIIEYIRKLEAQVVNNHQKLSGEIDRLERLLDKQSARDNPFKDQRKKIDNWELDTTYTTSGT